MSRRAITYAAAFVVCAALMGSAFIALTSGDDGTGDGVAQCTGASALDFGCYAKRYTELAHSSGAEPALEDLAGHMEESGYVRAACHQLVHRVGRAAGERSGIDAFGEGDPLCGSGYYHGVTEAVMSEIGAEDVVDEAATVCAELRESDPYSVDLSNCVHGMGHGFMWVLRRDLPEALQGCDALEDGWERHGCYSGVFMENLSTVDQPRSEYLRPGRPFELCTSVARRYKVQCYDRQTTYALYVSDTDFTKVFRLCSRTEEDFRAACFRGLGGDVSAETKLIVEDAAQTQARRRLCMLGADLAARSSCMAGAVDVMLQDLDGGPAQVDAFCKSFEAVSTQELHAACLRASEEAYGELLAQQQGRDPEQPVAVGGDFICHLNKSKGRT